ncbi:MAG: hypothetical protein Q9190_008079, partial [Brigantiaea leucoxantha]
MLYDLCSRNNIPHRNCGKWILAQTSSQHERLSALHQHALSIGVPMHFVPLSEARNREPDVLARKAVLESPTTGILDSHAYMSHLESDFQSLGGDLACHTTVTAINPLSSGSRGYEIQTTTTPSSPESTTTTITAETLINSAGLAAIPLSNSILPPHRHLTAFYAKGSYYSYTPSSPRPSTLIYPAPTPGAAGLGTHLTLDMTGAVRFGPDIEWIDDPTDL